MELYEYARPKLMSGKKILYVHGFASSGQNGSVKTLRLLLPEAEVIAPDLPVEPSEALALLKSLVEEQKPELIIGTSMGAMYAELLHGSYRILVNPAFRLADTILKNNGLGLREYHNPRQDGQKSFIVTKALLEAFRELSSHCFENIDSEEDAKVFALFGKHDTMVDTWDLTREHYSQCIRFDGSHYLNDAALLHSVLPVIQWIDDIQNEVSRPSLLIAFDDVLSYRHNSEMIAAASKAVQYLAPRYDLHFVVSGAADEWEEMLIKRNWIEEHIAVPAWNRVSLTTHKELLLGDFLVDAHPEECGGNDFMGTLIHFGSDGFKDWNEVMTYFSRLYGE